LIVDRPESPVVNQAPPSRAAAPRGTIAEWTVTVILLLFGTTTLVQAFVIPTGSMEDTLLIGDHLLVDKLAYAPDGPLGSKFLPYQDIKRGDIIVFRYPVDISQTFVKRVIGMPGDRIHIQGKQLYRNGVRVEETYKFHKTDYFNPYRDDWPGTPDAQVLDPGLAMLRNNIVDGEVLVPPDNYFALGDNRDSSLDSRYWGFVPRANIIGKPLIIYWSYDASTEALSGPTLSPDHLLDIARNFFSKTRWKRTFRLIRAHPVE
jgi:signal peptidase I